MMTLVLLIGLMMGALGAVAMLNHKFVDQAAQIVRESTEQLFIHIRTILPTSDTNVDINTKTTLSNLADKPRIQQI